MIKWDYTRKDYKSHHNIIEELNKMGADGWEVIDIKRYETNSYDRYYHTVYFKRRINELDR